jgi:hypothetical protein
MYFVRFDILNHRENRKVCMKEGQRDKRSEGQGEEEKGGCSRD